ncbi:DUF2279 domain-containing protein [uncultured Roseivirga sp.]|uniref:DUF2279 domain-containing protein n=1 Tax=uncultured Roseivirga sp. TaxID=543088 RepID=UPI000D7B4642|nr:DUF2279 domain-containing protein [uncultured Roseivirga sp.]PWL28964.1 MAG: DUF2279 domain-containing protein [Roseivirga sp. XM-24bin3]
MRRFAIFICLLICTYAQLLGQSGIAHPVEVDYPINLKKVKLYGGIGYATAMLVLSQAWYAENGLEHFKFFNDNAEWLQVDKLGHTYGTYHLSRINFELLRRTELSDNKALIWGSLLSTALFLPIEILDGFSPDYGFSYGDMIANAAGSGIFYFQQKAWNEQRIKLKFSFQPSNLSHLRPETLGSNFPERLLKDYNGQNYWFSVDVHAFAKESNWPKWINLTLGYGAHQMIFARNHENEAAGFNNYRQYYLGIDFDLSHIQTSSRFLKTVLFLTDFIRLPAPTLQLSQGKVTGHILYF